MAIQFVDIADKTTLDSVDTKVDVASSTRAPASTALSNATWTNARAVKVDNLDTTVSSRAPASTALSNATWTADKANAIDTINTNSARLTATRAGYIDDINTNAARLTAERAGKIDNIGATADTGGSITAGTAMAKLNKVQELLSNSGISVIKSIQSGVTATAGTVTINEVNVSKSFVLSKSKGSAGTVAATGNITGDLTGAIQLKSAGSGGVGATPQPITLSGTRVISGGTTNLTVKEFSARIISSTQLSCDGPCEWQVIEFN